LRLAVPAVLAALLLLLPATASAALPAPGAKFEAHDHVTKGANWHIEMEIGKEARQIKQLVLYAQRCGETVYEENLGISNEGTVRLTGTLPASSGGGTWRVDGFFAGPERFEGSFEINENDCKSGKLAYVAAGSGGAHNHSSHHHHTSGANPWPNFKAASVKHQRQARRLYRQSWKYARRWQRFKTALHDGFDFLPEDIGLPRPRILHLRHSKWSHDKRHLWAKRPESLVYWVPRNPRSWPVLVGIMYRWPGNKKPTFGGPLLQWHRHWQTKNNRFGSSQMTHFWMTRSLRAAFANCFPTLWLQQTNRAFRWETPRTGGSGPETDPCPPPPPA
jgi:hypothetical protein